MDILIFFIALIGLLTLFQVLLWKPYRKVEVGSRWTFEDPKNPYLEEHEIYTVEEIIGSYAKLSSPLLIYTDTKFYMSRPLKNIRAFYNRVPNAR